MAETQIHSLEELPSIEALLKKNVPAYRQAYSDRTAWLMACLSELVYFRFNPSVAEGPIKTFIKERVEQLLDDERAKSAEKLIDLLAYDHDASKAELMANLKLIGMTLLEPTFDKNGTQAILVEFNEFIVLAFRGTEATSIRDIKADAKATPMPCDSGGMVHSGFKEAFECVATRIQNELEKPEYENKSLFITGHSLGGALATIAAKRLQHKAGIAACYTFGSPRVGDETWIADMKTPVYRLVNAADCVTMLPPGTETVTVFSWLVGFIPYVGDSLKSWIIAKLGGYLHGGNMRYLTNCPPSDFSSVRLLYSVSLVYRIKGLIYKKLPWKVFLADHSISVYRKKLAIIAKRRNGIDS